MSSSGSDSDSLTAPGVRELIRQAENALDSGDRDQARNRLAKAQTALLESRADELDMSEELETALQDAVEAPEFTEDLPVGPDSIPNEWEIEGLDLDETPAQLECELQGILGEGPFRATIEPEPGKQSCYRLRFESLRY